MQPDNVVGVNVSYSSTKQSSSTRLKTLMSMDFGEVSGSNQIRYHLKGSEMPNKVVRYWDPNMPRKLFVRHAVQTTIKHQYIASLDQLGI